MIIWNAASGQQVLTLKGHTNDVNSVAWSPREAEPAIRMTLSSEIFAPDRASQMMIESSYSVTWGQGDQLASASASEDRTVVVWNVASGENLSIPCSKSGQLA